MESEHYESVRSGSDWIHYSYDFNRHMDKVGSGDCRFSDTFLERNLTEPHTVIGRKILPKR